MTYLRKIPGATRAIPTAGGGSGSDQSTAGHSIHGRHTAHLPAPHLLPQRQGFSRVLPCRHASRELRRDKQIGVVFNSLDPSDTVISLLFFNFSFWNRTFEMEFRRAPKLGRPPCFNFQPILILYDLYSVRSACLHIPVNFKEFCPQMIAHCILLQLCPATKYLVARKPIGD